MTELTSTIISSVIQLVAFTLIPFIFFLFRKDKKVTFFRYIGLYKPTGKAVLYVLIAALLIVFGGIGLAYMNEGIKEAVFSPNSVTGQLRRMGLSATTLLILFITALFKTSLAEEILFRGLIGKQLINKFGFKAGNILQALFFGFIHLLLFWVLTKTTIAPLFIIFIFSSLAGWIIGYIKEQHANGSIIPGWVAHGLGNIVSYYILAFVM